MRMLLVALVILDFAVISAVELLLPQQSVTLVESGFVTGVNVGNYTTTSAQWLGQITSDGPYVEITAGSFQQIVKYIVQQPGSVHTNRKRLVDTGAEQEEIQYPSVCLFSWLATLLKLPMI
jgi:hypothetical protein